MKKGLIIATLAGLGICALMLIITVLEIANLNFLTGTLGHVLASVATLTAAGYFSIMSHTMLSKNKILGYVSFGLIGLSLIFMILFIWNLGSGDIFNNAVLTISLLSVLFIFLGSNNLKLGKQFLVVQIICDAILSLLIALILLSSYKILKLDDISSLFIINIILAIVAFITISVLAKKVQGDNVNDAKAEYVKITKAEYEELLGKAKELESLKNK